MTKVKFSHKSLHLIVTLINIWKVANMSAIKLAFFMSSNPKWTIYMENLFAKWLPKWLRIQLIFDEKMYELFRCVQTGFVTQAINYYHWRSLMRFEKQLIWCDNFTRSKAFKGAELVWRKCDSIMIRCTDFTNCMRITLYTISCTA